MSLLNHVRCLKIIKEPCSCEITLTSKETLDILQYVILYVRMVMSSRMFHYQLHSTCLFNLMYLALRTYDQRKLV
jgi:hypothetical protein